MSDPNNRRVGTPKDPETTRGRILDAALEVFAEKGYHEASVDEIVEESQTSKGSVYFHFPNKQTLFLSLVDKFSNLLERRIKEAISQEEEGIAQVDAALTACLETFGQYRPLAKVMLVQAMGLGTAFEQKLMEVHNRFATLIKVYLDQAVALGEIAPVDTNIVSRAWMGAINEVVMHWVMTGESSPKRIMETLRPMLLRSVGVQEDRI
ncbi:MAG: TetR family transcriptional regulator [Chloroflexi bacterium OLB15]|nr:MAG: TetR family transcriptional regulator [Chloroflexi bacterium OLB15]